MTKEIVLIIVGIIIVIVSFMITERNTNKEEEDSRDFEVLKSELKEEVLREIKEEKENFQKEGSLFLQNKQNDLLEKMNDEMSRFSNEKIMAFSEYGEQISGKIEQNHQEVVFLYDMLNQKEAEMKQFVRELDNEKVDIEEMLFHAKEEKKEWEAWKQEKEESMQELARKEIALQKAMEEEKQSIKKKQGINLRQMEEEKGREEQVPVLTAADILNAKKEGRKIDFFSVRKQTQDVGFTEIKKGTEGRNIDGSHEHHTTNNSPITDDRGPAANIDGPFTFGEVSMGNQDIQNNSFNMEEEKEYQEEMAENETETKKNDLNESVLELHKQGMSVMEIARILGRGQGEVKLIIDLYHGAKR